MSLTLRTYDVSFLDRVQEMGRSGLSQEEMAVEMGLPISTFRLRVRDLGFEFERRTELKARAQFGGRPYEDMRGDIIVADAGEQVPA